MTDTRTATVRTSWHTTLIAALAYLASRLFGWEISTDDPLLLLVVPVVVGIFYRASVALSEAVPWIGYVLFGVNRSPEYSEPPPEVPRLADEG